jgi:adenylate cyclase
MLGDSVNLAARLEGVNKQFGTYTMISAATRELMGEDFAARELARVAVVGKKEPVTVYEPMWPEVLAARTPVLEIFARGLSLFYAGRFFDAAAVFAEIEDRDPPAARYRIKCRELAAAPPEQWEGIWVMSTK